MMIEIHQPELENIIRERMASGEFQNIEEVLMQALKASPSPASSGKPKKTLGQFVLESPLRDSGLKVERQQDFDTNVISEFCDA